METAELNPTFSFSYFKSECANFRKLMQNKDTLKDGDVMGNAFKALTYLYFNAEDNEALTPLYLWIKEEYERRLFYIALSHIN